MNQPERNLILDWLNGRKSNEDLLSSFPVNYKDKTNYLMSEVESAIENSETDDIRLLAEFICRLPENDSGLIDVLHKLLLNPNHLSHQYILLKLQKLANPKSVPFIRKALETNFDYIPYTGSDLDAIAKWFSWALASIGTDEAIDLIREYSNSEDEDIRKEMSYRLKRIEKGL